MYRQLDFKKALAMSAGLLLLFLTLATPLSAADNSSGSATYDDDNDCSKGYSCGNPQDSWRGLDMIYYKENMYNVYYKPYNHEDPNQTIALRIYRRPVTEEAEGCPDHISVPEGTQTYASTDRRHSAVRFAVFKDLLRLFFAKTYDDNTGYILWVKTSPDGVTFPSDSVNLWENRPNDDDNPITIQGLVVKVMNDVLYVFIQAKNTHDLYLITSSDGTTYSSPQKIATLSGNDCLLNGDVFMRGSDTQPMMAFVTKDDALGGSNATGVSKLYVFDPTDKSVTYVTTLTDKWKDLAVVAGNVYNCTPYSINSLQIWGLKRDHDNLYHMQFIFNEDGKTGAFDPAGYVDTGHNCSEHVDNEFRSYLAACSAPEQVADGSLVSLQSYDWVWWWGSTSTANAYGKSLKYKADFMKNLGSEGDQTTAEGPDPKVNYVNDGWVLLGVLTGLPPYYPNAIEQEWLGDYYKVSYGNEYELKVSTSVTSEKSVSIGYKKEWLKGKVSMGASYAYAVEETTGNEKETTAKETLEFDPTFITPGIENGSQAWGIFLAPYITSDRYELYAPDKSTDLGLTLYYTYIGDNSSIVAQIFDMTDAENPVNDPFFHGFPNLPNSLDYEIWQDHGPAIVNTGTTDYDTLLSKQILCNNCSSDFEFSQTMSVENEQKNTNKISFSGGAFGFEGEMEGALTMASSTKTSLGQNITVHYGVPGFEEMDPPPADYDRYLTYMNMNMYLLNAKTQNAFWIPEGAKTADRQHYPWCLTWDVLTYKNMGMYTVKVGASQPHETVGSALKANPGSANAEIQINTSVTEKEELFLSDGMSVTVRGPVSTLDRYGCPTVTFNTRGFTIEEGAHLHLENLIVNTAGVDPMMEIYGDLSVKNCRILGDERADGIVQNGGTLSMDKTYLSKIGGDGLRVETGRASLVNCAFTGNGGKGIHNENGTVILEHCVLLQNAGSDFFAGSSAVSEATNTVFGSMAPDATISKLLNCLIENLPESVVIKDQADCILNTSSGYIVKNGELDSIMQNSPCVDAGAASINESFDISGKFREQKPDIGSLEHSHLMEIKSIETFDLATHDADPSTETDSLRLVLDMKAPSDVTLAAEALYAVSFGNHIVTSKQFDLSSEIDNGLVFSMNSGKSTLRMELSSDRKRLKMSLNLSDDQLYQDISQYLLNARDQDPNSNISTVYVPLRASAGKFQTGEVWMDFRFEEKDGVGKGSEARLHPSESSDCAFDCDDDSCFISALN